MLRTEALTRFAAQAAGKGNRTGLLVTYPEALYEKVVLPDSFSGNIIYLKSGDNINVDGLMEQMVELRLPAYRLCLRTRTVCPTRRYPRYLFFWQRKALPGGALWQRCRLHPHIRSGNTAKRTKAAVR